MKSALRVMLTLLIATTLGRSFATDIDGGPTAIDALRKQIFQSGEYKWSFTDEEFRLYVSLPIGSDVDNLNCGPQTKCSATFLGVYEEHGKKSLIFSNVRAQQLHKPKAGTHDPSLPSADYDPNSPVEAPVGETFNPPIGRILGDSLNAGLNAGITTGIYKGLIDSPSDRRRRAALQNEFDDANRRLRAAQDQMVTELSNYSDAIRAEIAEFVRRGGDYRPLDVAYSSQASSYEDGDYLGRLQDIRFQLSSAHTTSSFQKGIVQVGNAAADASENAHHMGQRDDAESLLAIGEAFVKVALGIHPVSGLVLDGHEFFTGTDAFSGAPLSVVEQSLAGVGFVTGLATAGISSSAIRAIRLSGRIANHLPTFKSVAMTGLGKLANHFNKIGMQTTDGWRSFVDFTRRTLGSDLGAIGDVDNLIKKSALGKWSRSFYVERIQTSDVLNAEIIARNPRAHPPYLPGTRVEIVRPRQQRTFLRFFRQGYSNKEGSWVTMIETVDRSMSPAELQKKYNLPHTPDMVSEVIVSPGTLMRRSKVNGGGPWHGGDRAIQLEILDPFEGNVKFKQPKPLTEFLRENTGAFLYDTGSFFYSININDYLYGQLRFS